MRISEFITRLEELRDVAGADVEVGLRTLDCDDAADYEYALLNSAT